MPNGTYGGVRGGLNSPYSIVQDGRTKRFSPAIDKSEAENEEVESLLDRVYNGNAGLLISNIISSDRLTEDQIEELRKLFWEE